MGHLIESPKGLYPPGKIYPLCRKAQQGSLLISWHWVKEEKNFETKEVLLLNTEFSATQLDF